MTQETLVDNVTCLGCGCACDDIAVVVRDGRIAQARNACPLGTRWFGDGQVPLNCRVNRNDAPLDHALSAATRILHEAARPLVYLAPGIASETQREASAIADLLGARLDSVTSSTAAPYVLASQELGFASATLGEIRNRADVVLAWAVDLDRRYPRFASRYAPQPVGTHVPRGRQSRTVIAVDVGAAVATVDADHRISIDSTAELATLSALEALVRAPASDARRYASLSAGAWVTARELALALMAARYIALVFDAEPDAQPTRSPQRFAALASLSQSLNDRTRCAAIALRAGGNRSGADLVMSAQTGFPFAIDFFHGWPRYDPYRGDPVALLADREADTVVAWLCEHPGTPWWSRETAAARLVVVGPAASTVTLGTSSVVIDTGVAGIHDGGTAFRTDDVPLPLRAPLSGRIAAVDVLRALTSSLLEHRGSSRTATSPASR